MSAVGQIGQQNPTLTACGGALSLLQCENNIVGRDMFQFTSTRQVA